VFAHLDARVLPDLPRELPVPDVERDDARRAALQQAVGEAAGRSADVEADFARRFDLKVVERRRELRKASPL
jgi:hypothetical protein